MATKSPADIAEKWGRNLKSSVPDITKGVEAVTEAPGVKAAAQQAKMLARLTESVNDGTWARRVAAVPLEEWKSKMINKGIGRISAGVDAATDKVVDFHAQLSAHQSNISAKLKTMANLTLEDSISRMTYQVREMSKFSKK